MKTILRKYDKNRVAILPTTGFPPEYARWLRAYAQKRGWLDFKIVQTKDQWKQLGVVCRPKQWLKLVKHMRENGEPLPIGFEQEFMDYCIKVMTEEEQFIEKKPTLTKDENEVLKVLVEKAHEHLDKGLPEDDQDLWVKEEKKEAPKKPKKKIHKLIKGDE